MFVAHLAVVVNAVQALVLPRVGVLEFIDHGHGVLIADCRCHLTFIGIQSGVQTLKQVLEIEHRQLQFGLLVLLAHLVGCVVKQAFFGGGFGGLVLAQRLDVGKDRVFCCLSPAIALKAAEGKALQGFNFNVRVVLTPRLQSTHPIGEVVGAGAFHFFRCLSCYQNTRQPLVQCCLTSLLGRNDQSLFCVEPFTVHGQHLRGCRRCCCIAGLWLSV